jgi:hypothetical protein
MAHVTASLNHLPQHATLVHTGPTVRSTVAKGKVQIANVATNVQPESNSGAADFRALFSSQPPPTPSTPAAAPNPSPTPESAFGSSPWLTNPVGKNPDGSFFTYNPWYFATPDAAAQVAQMLGGTVVASNEFTAPGSPFIQQQPNLMVQMSDGRMINAGLVASFYAHGYPQSYINTLIAAQINGTNG